MLHFVTFCYISPTVALSPFQKDREDRLMDGWNRDISLVIYCWALNTPGKRLALSLTSVHAESSSPTFISADIHHLIPALPALFAWVMKLCLKELNGALISFSRSEKKSRRAVSHFQDLQLIALDLAESSCHQWCIGN